MKTKLIFILLAGNLLGLCPAMAQAPLASEEVHYANEVGGEVIVRNQNDIVLVICSKAVDGSNDHTFMVRSLATGVTQGFTCNLGTMFSQPTDNYIIKDMRIFDRTCYFCGTKVSRVGEPLYDNQGNILDPGLTYDGFVGSFYTTGIGAGGNIEIRIIPETDSLTKLVVHRDNPGAYKAFIMAIGSITYGVQSTCIVELENERYYGNWRWRERIILPTGSEIPEILTDIILTDSYVEAVSKLCPESIDNEDCSHYIFRLHETKRDGFYYMSASPNIPTEVYQYDTRDYPYGYCYCQSNEPIRLSPLKADKFCVAFGSDRYFDRRGGPTAFQMNAASTMEHAQQLGIDTFCHIREAVPINQNQTTALLCHTSNRPNGIIRFAQWPNTTDYFAIELPGKKIFSIDEISERSVVGGFSLTNYSIGVMRQDLNGQYDGVTCFVEQDNTFLPLPLLEHTEDFCQWDCRYNRDIIWQSAPFLPRSMVPQTDCEMYNNNQ